MRAEMLRAVADRLEGADDELVALAITETHLTRRACAGAGPDDLPAAIPRRGDREGDFLQACIDTPDESWPPGARPDLRRLFLRPLGPVAVFAASNFPFAFSVAGGDSAFRPSRRMPGDHEGTSRHRQLSARCGEIVCEALRDAGAPEGTFAVVEGDKAGRRACHPSRYQRGGLHRIGESGTHAVRHRRRRLKPIPFYGSLEA